jgi:hypothetical protein
MKRLNACSLLLTIGAALFGARAAELSAADKEKIVRALPCRGGLPVPNALPVMVSPPCFSSK